MELSLIIIESISIALFIVMGISILLTDKKTDFHWASFVLIINAIFFYATYWETTKQIPFLFHIFFSVAVALPYTFAFFCYIYFADDKSNLKKFSIIVLLMYAINLFSHQYALITSNQKLSYLGYALSLAMLVFSSVLSLKGYYSDLLNKRRLTRSIVIILNSLLGIASVFSFMNFDPLKLPWSITIILLIGSAILLLSLFDIKIVLKTYGSIATENEEKSDKKAPSNDNLIVKRILEKLEDLFTHQKIYKTEKLTITKVSKLINEKEYLVRKAINTELGYTNFNQFLNYYRIEESKRLIEAAQNLSMKEIAFQVGYSEPSAFNRAFKNKEKVTPTAYKKKINNSEIN